MRFLLLLLLLVSVCGASAHKRNITEYYGTYLGDKGELLYIEANETDTLIISIKYPDKPLQYFQIDSVKFVCICQGDNYRVYGKFSNDTNHYLIALHSYNLQQANLYTFGEERCTICYKRPCCTMIADEVVKNQTPGQLLFPRYNGIFWDRHSREIIKVVGSAARPSVYYSNGQSDFVALKLVKADDVTGALFVAFWGEPNKVYRLMLDPWGWVPFLYCDNPDSTNQLFLGISDNPHRPTPADYQKEIQEMDGRGFGKPVTYLYPEYAMPIHVELDEQIPLLESYPPYPAGGWQVTATPDGRVLTPDGREYSYLFWDTRPLPTAWDQTTGRVLRRDQVLPYLQQALPEMGLTPREHNEFIVYWLPVLKETEWVQLDWAVYHTQDGQDLSNPNGRLMHAQAGIHITPAPQTLFRLMLLYRPVEGPRELKELPLPYLHRRGFTVVEWGGTRMGSSEVGME